MAGITFVNGHEARQSLYQEENPAHFGTYVARVPQK